MVCLSLVSVICLAFFLWAHRVRRDTTAREEDYGGGVQEHDEPRHSKTAAAIAATSICPSSKQPPARQLSDAAAAAAAGTLRTAPKTRQDTAFEARRSEVIEPLVHRSIPTVAVTSTPRHSTAQHGTAQHNIISTTTPIKPNIRSPTTCSLDRLMLSPLVLPCLDVSPRHGPSRLGSLLWR